jgi:hypothetical protein
MWKILPLLVMWGGSFGGEPTFGGGAFSGKPSGGGAPSCNEPTQNNLVVWLDGRNVDGANNTTLANNDPVVTWDDQGSLASDPTQGTGTSQPTFIESCLNGEACLRFDGGDFLLSALAASSFTFLHDGSDWTAYVVHKTATADPNAIDGLITTARFAAGFRGMSLGLEDRAALPVNDAARFDMSNGIGNNLQITTADDTIESGLWHNLVAKLDDDGGVGADGFVYIDGASIMSQATVGSYNSGDPSASLSIANTSSGSFIFAGDIVQVLIYQSAHSDQTRETVEDWVDCVYGTMPVTP